MGAYYLLLIGGHLEGLHHCVLAYWKFLRAVDWIGPQAVK
jgi:hypothetical protein